MYAMTQRAFTPEQDQDVADLYSDGMSLRRIAKKYGVGIQAVGRSLERAEVQRRPAGHDWRFSDSEVREIATRYEAGASMAELCSEYGCHVGTLRRALLRAGSKPRRRGAVDREIVASQLDDVMRRWKAGESQNAIAQSLGVSQVRVSRALRAYGHDPKEHSHTRQMRNGRWKGGRVRDSAGYVRALVHRHDPLAPMADNAGYIAEHRLVMARHLGRPLEKGETVHHKNGVRDDNRLENLQLMRAKHGPGQCFACADCGSRNVVTVEID